MNCTNPPRIKSSKHKRETLNIHLPSAGTINTVRTSKSVRNSQKAMEAIPRVTSSKSQENSPRFNQESTSKSSKKIQDLVKKTREMKSEVKQKDEFVEEKFNDLRTRINNSVAFLRSTQNQIENIKFMYQRDMLNMGNEQSFGDCLKSSDRSIEELNAEMEEIQKKLNTIRARTKEVRDKHTTFNNQNFESTVTETVNTLENIGRGDYSENV